MFSTKPIVVGRAVVEPALLEPVQCSENLQIAINNSDHITILDPIIPLLHNCIEQGTKENDLKGTIELNRFHDVQRVFNIPDLDSLGFQIFSRLLIKDGEDMFSFGRIAEPSIAGIQWSKVDDLTRDCYLGVLLNTGEVLVLKRTTQDAGQYNVIFRSFTCILDQMNLPQNRLTEEQDLIITNSELQELQITSFTFIKTHNGEHLISLAHKSGELTIHQLLPGLPLVSRVNVNGILVTQVWSEELSTLALARSDNSVVTIVFDKNYQPKGNPTMVKKPSRFLVSRIQFLSSDILIVTDTQKLHVYTHGSASHCELPYLSNILGLSYFKQESSHIVLLTFESAKLMIISISEGNCSILQPPTLWASFVNRRILQFQHACQIEQNRAPSEAFKPLLNDKVDVNFHLYGSQLCANGYIALVYNIVPKNVIHHDTRSKAEFKVDMLPLQSLQPSVNLMPPVGSSIAAIQRLLIQEAKQVPLLSSAGATDGDESLISYLDSLFQWKKVTFVNPREVKLKHDQRDTLKEALMLEFRENAHVNELQRLFLFNVYILETLEALKAKNTSSEAMQSSVASITEEQTLIRSLILRYLRRLVLAHWNPLNSNLDADRYIILTFYKLLPSDQQNAFSNVPESAKLIESTDLFTETFSLNQKDAIPDNFEQFALSESSHTWRRCDLTLLPIMQLNHKTDELGGFVYANVNTTTSELAAVLLSELNYCIYTGTRAFELKIGL